MAGLSQELIDYTIDHVHDRKSLEACSLVCSRWSPRSRKHLFVQVEFASEMDLQRWCACIPPGPSGPSSLVKDITLSEDRSPPTQPSGSSWIWSSAATDATPHFRSFSALQALEVRGWHMRTPCVVSMLHCFGSSLENVTRLVLRDVVITSILRSSFTMFVSHFPCLDDISISIIELRSSLSRLLREVNRTAHIEVVPTHPQGQFSASGSVVPNKVFRAITLLEPRFHRVALDCGSYDSWSVYWPLIEACAGSLEELHILANATGE